MILTNFIFQNTHRIHTEYTRKSLIYMNDTQDTQNTHFLKREIGEAFFVQTVYPVYPVYPVQKTHTKQ